ncbi:MAG: lysophospholipid acyltransferase family protein [Bacteroidales bacterium]|nr:lysophospholipid acyltransferase family protein [Bacteroidales bacterium]
MLRARFIMYCLIMPLAWLPLWVLYLLGDLIYPVVYHVVRYRRKVTRANLTKSFPDKSEKEIKRIEKAYYRHICDLLAEGVWGLRATPAQLLKRYHIVNAELLRPYYEAGRSVIIMSAHYNNWEMMIASLNFQLLHHGVGVGKHIVQKPFGRLLTQKRARYGTEIVDNTDVRQVMEFYDRYHVPTAWMMLGDQSPSDRKKCLWTRFLNQETAFIFGSEHFAKKYDYPVFYYEVRKVVRGYYEVRFEPLALNPQEEKDGDITRRYAARLEKTIAENPQYWLWSHRRWKLKTKN